MSLEISAHLRSWLSLKTQYGLSAPEHGQYAQFNANIGYRFSRVVETRFYLGAYIFDQKLPDTLSLADAPPPRSSFDMQIADVGHSALNCALACTSEGTAARLHRW